MLSKFLNTKTLIVLLIVLIGIYFIVKLTESKDRTFRSEMVTADTADITKMVITPKLGSKDNEVVFTRSGDGWKLESDGKTYKPDITSINNMLSELIRMKSERVAATDKSKWAEFEVTDSTGTQIKLYNKGKVLADLYIGKFDYSPQKGNQQNPYQQNRGKMSTFVRPADDQEVYAVEGFIKMSIQANANAYRDKTLFAANKDDLTKITFDYPNNENFVLSKENNAWLLNGQPTDSAKTVRYLNKLTKVTSSSFIDTVQPLTPNPAFTVKFEGNNILTTEIKAFPADSVNKFVITSSLIPDSKYSGSKSGLFERIFPKEEDFFAEKK